MSLIKAVAVLALMSVADATLAADVYVCEKNGRKEFSQLPCGDNAVVLKTEGDPANLKISVPMKQKEVSALCKLVIKAKDQTVKPQAKSYPRYDPYYNRRSNYRYNRNHSYYDDYELNASSRRVNPQEYLLSHIANLEQIARESTQLYKMIKSLINDSDYQGYETSPIYEAERAAALADCERNVSDRIDNME